MLNAKPYDASGLRATRRGRPGPPSVRLQDAAAAGRLQRPRPGLDWLFDIVEPREGDWNIFAHDQTRLRALLALCQGPGQAALPAPARLGVESSCPVDELRISGSPYYLLTRFYEESASESLYF